MLFQVSACVKLVIPLDRTSHMPESSDTEPFRAFSDNLPPPARINMERDYPGVWVPRGMKDWIMHIINLHCREEIRSDVCFGKIALAAQDWREVILEREVIQVLMTQRGEDEGQTKKPGLRIRGLLDF